MYFLYLLFDVGGTINFCVGFNHAHGSFLYHINVADLNAARLLSLHCVAIVSFDLFVVSRVNDECLVYFIVN